MTPERTKELLPVMQAFAEGKEIQYKSLITGDWGTCKNPSFSSDHKYRIKPEPRVYWVNEFPCGAMSGLFHSKNAADPAYNSNNRIACHRVELPPKE